MSLKRGIATKIMLQSLRSQFLIPLSLAMLLTGAVVIGLAYGIAASSAKQAIEKRLQSVSTIASEAAYPLTSSVLKQMRDLSSLEIAILQNDGKSIIATDGLIGFQELDLQSVLTATKDTKSNESSNSISIAHRLKIGDDRFDIAVRRLSSLTSSDGRHWVAVLSRHSAQQKLKQQAVVIPMITGAVATLVIGWVATLLASRMRKKIGVLRSHVGKIAKGSLEKLAVTGPSDEIAALTCDINQMTQQLHEFQTSISVNQRATLINQIASGMAHQLRNTLTGARLAIQVFQRVNHQESAKDLVVAIDQLKLAEQSIQSLLQVRTGIDEQPTEAMAIEDLILAIESLVKIKAEHKKIDLKFNIVEQLSKRQVPDGQTVLGALLNLMLNAIEAAPEQGHVSCEVSFGDFEKPLTSNSSSENLAENCRFSVVDNGLGPAESIVKTMLDPFSTTKPEGVGLGLPMAKRTSQRLGGDLAWRRIDGRTEFVMSIPLFVRKP